MRSVSHPPAHLRIRLSHYRSSGVSVARKPYAPLPRPDSDMRDSTESLRPAAAWTSGVRHCPAREHRPHYNDITHAEQNKRERKLSASYPLGDPKAKSTRERCIWVATIIIMIIAGLRSICVTERRQQLEVHLHCSNKNAHR